MTARWPSTLAAQHRKLLQDSAISAVVATKRGYVSFGEGDRSKLASLGFTRAQQRVPGLMIPIRHADGSSATVQYRPDEPRVLRDKPVKYESVPKAPLAIDVHPLVAVDMDNPEVELWITEGARKVDAGVTAGLCIVGLAGVWCWRGKNSEGGKTALGDWHDIALNGRLVYIAFDADSRSNKMVAAAIAALARFLQYKGAMVKIVSIPVVNDDPHTGLDDYLAAKNTIGALIQDAVDAGADDDQYSLTDDGNALRLIDLYEDQIRFVPERGRWLRWHTERWRWDVEGLVREHARLMARNLPEGDDDQVKFKKRSLSAGGVSNMLRLGQTDDRIVVNIADLDADPHQLNTPSGVVDLRSGEVRAHVAGDMVTKITTVGLADTAAPLWAKFLRDTFGDDEELTGYVQRLLGHSLVGAVTEHILPFCHGAGANGKSVLLNVCMSILGVGENGYAISAPSDFLMAKSATVHPTEIARLRGARLVVCQELNSGQRFDEAKVKQLTGGDALAGRFMRQDYFTFTPTHHLWLAGNHTPEVRVGGPAFWRRVRLIPFAHVVPENQRDSHLTEKLLEAEGPAILYWLVQGAASAYAEGIGEPAAVITATAAYRMDEDVVAAFTDQCCEIPEPAKRGQPQYAISVVRMREGFVKWCAKNGVEPLSSKALTQRLRALGVTSDRTSYARAYQGIRLLPVEPADEGATRDG